MIFSVSCATPSYKNKIDYIKKELKKNGSSVWTNYDENDTENFYFFESREDKIFLTKDIIIDDEQQKFAGFVDKESNGVLDSDDEALFRGDYIKISDLSEKEKNIMKKAYQDFIDYCYYSLKEKKNK